MAALQRIYYEAESSPEMTERKFELEVKQCYELNHIDCLADEDVYLNRWNLFQISPVLYYYHHYCWQKFSIFNCTGRSGREFNWAEGRTHEITG